MLNVLIPVTKKSEDFAELVRKISTFDDVAVFVGVEHDLIEKYTYLKSENVVIVEYENGCDKEMIINGLQLYVQTGSVMVMREPISVADFKKFLITDKDIVYCRTKRNRFMNFIITLWIKILRFLIGVTIYRGNTAVVYFDENLVPVILSTQNLSFASRADRWRGVEKSSLDISCKYEKYPVDKKVLLTNIIIILTSLIVGITVPILVCMFTKVSIIGGLLLFCLDALCLSAIVLCLVIILFSLKVGVKNPKHAVELNVYSDFQENYDEEEEIYYNEEDEGDYDEEN